MRVRAAGALLLAPLLAVTYEVMQRVGQTGNGNSIVKALFWNGAGSYQPKAWLAVRDVIFFAVLVIAIVAIFGPRFSRWLVASAGVALIVLYVPWVVYDSTLRGSRPPNWLAKNYPWYLPARASAIMWIAVAALAVILALTDRDPRHVGRRSRYVQPPPQAQPTQQFAPPGYPPPGSAGPPPSAGAWQPPQQPAPQGYTPSPHPQVPDPAGPPAYRPDPSAAPADRPVVPDPPTETYSRPDSPPAAPSADDPTQVQPRTDPNDR